MWGSCVSSGGAPTPAGTSMFNTWNVRVMTDGNYVCVKFLHIVAPVQWTLKLWCAYFKVLWCAYFKVLWCAYFKVLWCAYFKNILLIFCNCIYYKDHGSISKWPLWSKKFQTTILQPIHNSIKLQRASTDTSNKSEGFRPAELNILLFPSPI